MLKPTHKSIRAYYDALAAYGERDVANDPYVKFFRWATDRLGERDGIVCFVSNNSFVEQVAFDGMRKHLLGDFTLIYHFDLEGNVRQNPTLSGTQYNVFGIQVGVGVTVAVRNRKHKESALFYSGVDKALRRADKLRAVASKAVVSSVPWRRLTPDTRHTWLVPAEAETFAAFTAIGDKQARTERGAPSSVIFKDYSLGVATHRDRIVYDFLPENLIERIGKFIEAYNTEVDRWKRAPKGAKIDEYVKYDTVVWDRDLKKDLQRGRYVDFRSASVRKAMYRPFSSRNLYFDRILNAEVYGFPSIFPSADTDNTLIWLKTGSEIPPYVLVSNSICDLMSQGGSQCFPFYIYDDDGTNCRENITDWAQKLFREHYKDKKITKWNIFYYVYGLLHHPGYRTRYADNLKRELPRIPLAPDFWAFSRAGKELAERHLNDEQIEPYTLEWIETPDEPLSYRVEKMKLAGGRPPNQHDKKSLRVNDSLTLAGIPPEVFEYRLGNRSALEWVIDQYQVSTDKRSGITSDANRDDDPEYIVRLVGQVIRVSLETVRIVNALPADFGAPK